MRPLVLAAALLAAAPAARAAGLAGEWVLPAGRVTIKDTANGVVGTLTEPDKGCGALAKGAEVMHGDYLDGTFSGEIRVCLEGPQCTAKESWLSALLMADASGSRLSGAIERGNDACHARVPGKGGVVLRRWTPGGAPHSDARAKIAKPALKRAQDLVAAGGEFLQIGDAEKARAKFEEALAVAPLAEAYNGVGVSHYLRNEYPEALFAYKQAIDADPDFGDAYYNTACIYALTGKKDLAFKALELAAKNRFHDFSALDDDQDLSSLHNDPKWAALKRLTAGRSRKR